MPREIVSVTGEKVPYQKWLEGPVYKTLSWSPLGAHIEALANISQGQKVPGDVLKVEGADFTVDDSSTFFQIIKHWNRKNPQERLVGQKSYFFSLLADIALIYAARNVSFSVDEKGELLQVAVRARLNQPDPGFQGA